MAGIRKATKDQLRRRADDMAEWRRRQDLYRAYDGPVPPRMMARAGDGEARLEGLVRDGEERASRYDAAAEKWLELGKPDLARRCREDAKRARDTAALNRDVLDKLRRDRAGACPGLDPGASETGVADERSQSAPSLCEACSATGMSEAAATETNRTVRLYESTLRAIAERTEEPGSAFIASTTLACVEAERQARQAP